TCAASLENHTSALAHHLYQAGTGADSQRTATFLVRAGRQAMSAGAFEELLELCDQVIGLELREDNRLMAEAFEQRGTALLSLQRVDAAIAVLEHPLALYIERRDDAGIFRAASCLSHAFGSRFRADEAISMLRRALAALSGTAGVALFEERSAI